MSNHIGQFLITFALQKIQLTAIFYVKKVLCLNFQFIHLQQSTELHGVYEWRMGKPSEEKYLDRPEVTMVRLLANDRGEKDFQFSTPQFLKGI